MLTQHNSSMFPSHPSALSPTDSARASLFAGSTWPEWHMHGSGQARRTHPETLLRTLHRDLPALGECRETRTVVGVERTGAIRSVCEKWLLSLKGVLGVLGWGRCKPAVLSSTRDNGSAAAGSSCAAGKVCCVPAGGLEEGGDQSDGHCADTWRDRALLSSLNPPPQLSCRAETVGMVCRLNPKHRGARQASWGRHRLGNM